MYEKVKKLRRVEINNCMEDQIDKLEEFFIIIGVQEKQFYKGIDA